MKALSPKTEGEPFVPKPIITEPFAGSEWFRKESK